MASIDICTHQVTGIEIRTDQVDKHESYWLNIRIFQEGKEESVSKLTLFCDTEEDLKRIVKSLKS